MNFKKSWKRANDGFTLVELIVVIAILAILAGIAVPAYSGYIKKANKAADLQLLGAVNTAFAAAALDAENVSISSEPNGKYGFNVSSMTPSAYQEEFAKYFAGNDAAEFKVITGLLFVDGAFVDGGEGASGNMTGAQIQAAVNRYNASNMAGKEDKLVESVGNLSSALAGQLDTGALTTADLKTHLGGEENYSAFMDKYNLDENSSGTEKANALIMYTASALEGVTAQDIATMTGGDLNNMGKLVETYGSIPTAAMMYGVITGYANSEYASEEFKKAYETPPTGITAVTNMVTTMTTDPNWAQYLASQEKGATADMDGFFAAMEVVNGHEGSFDLTQSDAFTNDETMALLESILGNK